MTPAEVDTQRRLAAIEERLARLEGLPALAPLRSTPAPFAPERRFSPYAVVQVCPKCGVNLDKVSGYACPHRDCPTGLDGASSQIRTD